MPNKKLNPKLLWIQFEDVLAPRLGLTVWDRAVYSYLLRLLKNPHDAEEAAQDCFLPDRSVPGTHYDEAL